MFKINTDRVKFLNRRYKIFKNHSTFLSFKTSAVHCVLILLYCPCLLCHSAVIQECLIFLYCPCLLCLSAVIQERPLFLYCPSLLSHSAVIQECLLFSLVYSPSFLFSLFLQSHMVPHHFVLVNSPRSTHLAQVSQSSVHQPVCLKGFEYTNIAQGNRRIYEPISEKTPKNLYPPPSF